MAREPKLIAKFRVVVYQVDHPWRMNMADTAEACNIAKRKIRQLGVELILSSGGLISEPALPPQPFPIESQVAGYMWSKLQKRYPSPDVPPSDGGPLALHAFLIRTVPKTMNTGRVIHGFYGTSGGHIGAAPVVDAAYRCCVSGSAYDYIRKAPTTGFLSGLILAHEIAHMLGAAHDDSNVNIMANGVNNYSRYTRAIKFNRKAKLEVRETVCGKSSAATC